MTVIWIEEKEKLDSERDALDDDVISESSRTIGHLEPQFGNTKTPLGELWHLASERPGLYGASQQRIPKYELQIRPDSRLGSDIDDQLRSTCYWYCLASLARTKPENVCKVEPNAPFSLEGCNDLTFCCEEPACSATYNKLSGLGYGISFRSLRHTYSHNVVTGVAVPPAWYKGILRWICVACLGEQKDPRTGAVIYNVSINDEADKTCRGCHVIFGKAVAGQKEHGLQIF